MNTVRRAIAVVLLLTAAASAWAEDTLLTVRHGDHERHYDMAALLAFEPVEITTSTIWTEGPQTFVGVPLSTLIQDLGVSDGTVVAMAINDYSATIPLDEITPEAPILAYHRNGAPMPLRDKGPLWLVYPYDSDSAYRSEVIYSRSVWQLDRLDLTP